MIERSQLKFRSILVTGSLSSNKLFIEYLVNVCGLPVYIYKMNSEIKDLTMAACYLTSKFTAVTAKEKWRQQRESSKVEFLRNSSYDKKYEIFNKLWTLENVL